MKILAFAFLYSIGSYGAECPLGTKETELSISRVMRNFGRFSREAEMVGLNGKDNPTYVKESSLDKAISDLDVVVACADKTLDNPSDELLPNRYFELKTELEKENYLIQFFSIMTEFKNSTIEFQKLLKIEKNKNTELRNYKIVYDYDKVFNEIVDRAHKILTDEE